MSPQPLQSGFSTQSEACLKAWAGQVMNHLASMGLLLLTQKMCCCRVNSMEA